MGGVTADETPLTAREADLLAEVEFLRRQLAANSGAHRLAMEDSREELASIAALNAALNASEERLRLIVEAAADYAILTVDTERTVATWSAGAAAVFGYTAAEIIGQSSDILFTPEDRADGRPVKEVAIAREAGGAPDVRWHQRKDGSQVFLNGSMRPLRNAAGAEIGFLKIARDETERRAAEEKLEALNATLAQRVGRTGSTATWRGSRSRRRTAFTCPAATSPTSAGPRRRSGSRRRWKPSASSRGAWRTISTTC